MKKMRIILSLIVCLLLSVSAFPLSYADGPEEKDLLILYTSDVHCAVDRGWGYVGLCAMKQRLSKDYNLILVDDGDAIKGEPIGLFTKGESIINIMNAVGYDIAIPGNHEFDYGADYFLELTKKANFPYLSCNVTKNGELVLEPWLIREIGGMKIGFVGVTTPDTLRGPNPQLFQDGNGSFLYGFMEDASGEKLCEAVQNAVDEVRAEGADYVVLLAHLGSDEECRPWTYSDVISGTTGIDAVLDGHSHDTAQVVMKNREGRDVVRSACGARMEHVGALHITRDGEISSELYTWASDPAAPELLELDNAVSAVVAAESDELNARLSEVVANASVDLITSDPDAAGNESPDKIILRTETNLGDLCADAFLDQAGGADIAFINGGGIRSPIAGGDLTLNDFLEVYPFGNSIAVVEATGRQVLDILEWSVHALPDAFQGFEQVAGLRFEYDSGIDSPCVQDDQGRFDHIDGSMARRVRNVFIGGEPLDPEKTYRVASHDFMLLNGGDGYTMVKDCKVLMKDGKQDYQALADYITGTLGGVIGPGYENPFGQGRIVSVNGA